MTGKLGRAWWVLELHVVSAWVFCAACIMFKVKFEQFGIIEIIFLFRLPKSHGMAAIPKI